MCLKSYELIIRNKYSISELNKFYENFGIIFKQPNYISKFLPRKMSLQNIQNNHFASKSEVSGSQNEIDDYNNFFMERNSIISKLTLDEKQKKQKTKSKELIEFKVFQKKLSKQQLPKFSNEEFKKNYQFLEEKENTSQKAYLNLCPFFSAQVIFITTIKFIDKILLIFLNLSVKLKEIENISNMNSFDNCYEFQFSISSYNNKFFSKQKNMSFIEFHEFFFQKEISLENFILNLFMKKSLNSELKLILLKQLNKTIKIENNNISFYVPPKPKILRKSIDFKFSNLKPKTELFSISKFINNFSKKNLSSDKKKLKKFNTVKIRNKRKEESILPELIPYTQELQSSKNLNKFITGHLKIQNNLKTLKKNKFYFKFSSKMGYRYITVHFLTNKIMISIYYPFADIKTYCLVNEQKDKVK